MNETQNKFTTNKILFWAGAALSILISFVVFFKTMAPTVSFWDCGEFIASAYILGVPHPPGYPFYILLGKVFMILGIMSTPALNTNIMSPLSGSLTVFLAYLIIVKVAKAIVKPQGDLTGLGIYIGALTGSLLVGFGSSFWFNSVETEVLSAAMLVALIVLYMVFKWAEIKQAGGNDKMMVAVTYVLFLGLGVHLVHFLITPALILYFALVDREKLRDWRFWICWGVLISFSVPLHFIIYLIFPITLEYPLTTWFAMVVIFALICLYGLLKSAGKNRAGWGLYLALMVAAIVGFSTHLYIPIKAAQSPAINENNPSNLRRFEDYMSRKQYGQESMFTRMLRRRSTVAHQFGVYPHMGFWGYFRDQYTSESWGILRYLPFLFGLFGMYISLRKSFKNGFLLAAIFLIGSLGLILYLNFSDGTHGEQLEVRDRDYFYTPAFVFFALVMGLGFSVFLGQFLAWLKGKMSQVAAHAIWGVVALLVFLLPVDTVSYHWKTHDRTGDYMPPDYAYNILSSCDKDAILFTNGDNDTFPLWYLQEVERFRRDIRIVNLSLLNTDWYIYQLKHQMNVPMDLEDDQILWIPYDRRGQIVIYRPIKPFYDPIRKANRYLAPYQDPKTNNVVRVQDQMIELIVWANKWKYPIYFATSVPNSNRWILNDYTIRKGMALQVVGEKAGQGMDAATTENLIYNVYKYRGISDLDIYKDENNVGLTTTYPERFIELAKYYSDNGDSTKARKIYLDCIEKFPYYYQSYIDLKNYYADTVKNDSAQVIYKLGVNNLTRATAAWPEIVLYRQFLGIVHYAYKNNEEAIKCYKKALELDPSNNISFRFLLQLYTMTGKRDLGEQLLDWWVSEHPEDREAQQIKGAYRRMPNQ